METNTELIITNILFILLICLFLICLVIFLHSYISNKLHSQYHKGYDKAKDDKVQYYATISKLIDSYNEVFSELTKDGTGYIYKAKTLELMIDFKKYLENLYK